MEAMIAEAAVRDQVDLGLVSVDSTVTRAHHHAAGMTVDAELLDELEKAAAAEKVVRIKDKTAPWRHRSGRSRRRCARSGAGCADAARPAWAWPPWGARVAG